MRFVTSGQFVTLVCEGGVYHGKSIIVKVNEYDELVSPVEGYTVTFSSLASSIRGSEYSDDVRLVPVG